MMANGVPGCSAMFESLGKQVLHHGKHYADAVSVEAATAIASAMNASEAPEPPHWHELAIYQPPPGRHTIRQENDEFACSCGMRWDRSEGEEHP